MLELQAYTLRSKRWIYRGLRVLAAHGILYSTRVGPDEGRDRRRYRVRYWLRCDAQIVTTGTHATDATAGPTTPNAHEQANGSGGNARHSA